MFAKIVALLALCTSTGYALTLQEALEKAYQNNPTLSAAKNQANASRYQAYAGRGALLPTLSAEGTWGVTTYDQNSQTDTIHPRTGALTLTQPIFTGGNLSYAAAAANYNAKAAGADAAGAAGSILLQTVAAYTGTLAAAAQVSATESLVASLEKQEAAAIARLNAGEGTRTDRALTVARLKTAQGNLATAIAAYQSASQNLQNLLGIRGEETERGEEDKTTQGEQSVPAAISSWQLTWPEPAPALYVSHPKTEEEEEKESLPAAYPSPTTVTPPQIPASNLSPARPLPVAHPTLQAAEARAKAADKTYKSQRGKLLPSLNAVATTAYGEDTSTARTSGTQSSVQLQLNIPIFKGFSEFNTTRAAAANRLASADALRAAKNTLEANIINSNNNLEAYKTTWQAASAAAEAQQDYTTSIEKTYSYGEASLLDLLDARQSLAATKAAAAKAKADYITSTYAVLEAQGQLQTPPQR